MAAFGAGDLTTALVIYLRSLPAGDINTQLRDALNTLYVVTGTDVTTLLARRLADR